MDFEGALVVDEVDHLLESLRVCVIEEEPLVLRVAKSGAEVWAGDGKKEPVTTKLLPGGIDLYYKDPCQLHMSEQSTIPLY